MTVTAAFAAGFAAYLGAGFLLGVLALGAWRNRWSARRTGAPAAVRDASFAHGTAGALAMCLCAWLPVWFLTDSPWVGALAGGGAAFWRLRRPARRRSKALEDLHEAWPDGVRHLVASVRSGSTVEAAVLDLARTGPDPLKLALRRFPRLAPALGAVSALEAVREDIADPTTDRVTEVLIVAHEIGGSVVPAILEDLAEAVRADLRTIEEVRTSALEQRLNARLVFVVPWLVLALLLSRAGPYRAFYQSRPGATVLAVASVLSLTALIVVGRLGRDPLEPRVLIRRSVREAA